MAVSSEVARVVHTANGTATFFSYAPIDGVTSANLKVYLFNPITGVLTPQTLGTHYTFGSGGVTFNTAPPSGRRVILFRQVELLQPDIYKTNAPFPAVVTEKRFDEVVKGLQQLNDIAQNRAIILPLGDAGFSSNVLPAVEDRKGRVLYFNATTGDPEAKTLVAATVTTFPSWADSFLFQSTAAAGLANIGAVAKAGDTMTGFLTLHADPTAAMHAVTKQYVDRGTAGPVFASNSSAIDFTGIPAGVNQVRVIGISVATTLAAPRLRVGGSNILTTGYTSAGTDTSTGVNSSSSTTDFVSVGFDGQAAYNFVMTLVKAPDSDVWAFQSNGSLPSVPGTMRGTGWIDIGETLQQVRVFVASGTMSSGSFWVEWRR